ncbi:MAG TPA: inositol monophosphatase [Candidatus Moranbacteria bacterium]|nr:inositol monophosphatase [Candidatus Moranbacteria bacterium]
MNQLQSQSKFLEVAIQAAKKAERIIMEYYSKEIKSTQKADRSFVTEADKGAEKIIIETIRKEFPDHGFFGEESGKENVESQYVWVIDPIDGTNNFIHHIPIFGTQIALMKDREIILGVSNAPALGELMYAEKGGGAYLNEQKVSVSQTQEIESTYITFGGPKHFYKKNIIDNLAKLTADANSARGFGDFWSYHLVAQGKMDIMVEAKAKLYDIAAVKVIIEEAGGVVTNFDGRAISMDADSIIATNKKLHPKVLEYFIMSKE